MRLAITGVTGFIGRHLAAEAVRRGHDVLSLGRRDPQIVGVEHRAYDLSGREPPLVGAVPDVLIHLAAQINVAAPPTADQLLVNVRASWVLATWAAEQDVRHLHASTGGVYGCGDGPFEEGDPLAPLDAYSLTKSMAELAVSAVNPEASLIRYFFPYGPGTPNPLPDLIGRALRNEPVRVRSDGGPQFNPIHIDDAVEQTLGLAQVAHTGPINVAGAETISFADVVKMAAAMAGQVPSLELVEAEQLTPYYRSDLCGDVTTAEAVLGIPPKVSLQQGITQLIASMADAADALPRGSSFDRDGGGSFSSCGPSR